MPLPILASIPEPLRRERGDDLSGSSADAPGSQPDGEGLRTSQLGCQARWYRETLGHCSEPMLQYEWAWMNGRIAVLRGRRSAEPRADGLLSESQLFRTLLLQEFASRGLRPLSQRGTVVLSEEAWEITSVSVRQEWGIQP